MTIKHGENERLCSQCGSFFSQDVKKCPTCGDNTFNLSSKEDLDFLKYFVRTRRAVRFGKAFGISFGVFLMSSVPLFWLLGFDIYFSFVLLFIFLGDVLEYMLFLRLPRDVQSFEKEFIRQFPESRFFKTRRILSFLIFLSLLLYRYC